MDGCAADNVGETGWSLIKNLQFAGRRMAMGPKGLCNAGDVHTLSQQCVCVLCVWVYQLGRLVGFLSSKYLNNSTIRGQILLTSVTSGLHCGDVYRATNYWGSQRETGLRKCDTTWCSLAHFVWQWKGITAITTSIWCSRSLRRRERFKLALLIL